MKALELSRCQNVAIGFAQADDYTRSLSITSRRVPLYARTKNMSVYILHILTVVCLLGYKFGYRVISFLLVVLHHFGTSKM